MTLLQKTNKITLTLSQTFRIFALTLLQKNKIYVNF